MTKAKQILIVSPIPTHPTLHGNRARLKGVIEALKALGHKVVLIYGAREPIELADEREMAALVDHLLIIEPVKQADHTIKEKGFGLDDWWMPELDQAVQHIIGTLQIDVAMATYVWFSKWLELIDASVFKLLDTHDVFANRHARLASQGLAPQFFSTSESQENKGLARADAVLAIQDHEAADFLSRSIKQVHILGHLTKEQPTLSSKMDKNTPIRVGFFGSDNGLNQQAVKSMKKALKKQAGAAHLDWVLAGSIARHPVAEGWMGSKIVTLPTPADFYAAVDVVINPHMGGTGLKIKSVEALSFGKPLVGTKDAMIGLNSLNPFHNLESVEAVIDAVITLTKDETAVYRLQQESRDLFRHYNAKQYQTLSTLIAGPDGKATEGAS